MEEWASPWQYVLYHAWYGFIFAFIWHYMFYLLSSAFLRWIAPGWAE